MAAQPKDYSAALDALLDALRTPTDGRNLAWLADAITAELGEAEANVRDEWIDDDPNVSTDPEAFLSGAERLQLALRVVYHRLVSVPRMWVHVQQFWSDQQAHVVVLNSTGDEPIELSDQMALHSAYTAFEAIRELVGSLAQQYDLALPEHDWLPSPEDFYDH